jgi:WD40 repeat protein
MSAAATSFYQTGGNLPQNAPSYVERQADTDLYEGLQRGEFCYVLTARQMGKSSLMVRTAARLREAGIAVAVLDLTAIGQNLTVEQWYDGLLVHLGRQLDQEEELEQYWLAHERQSPLQRWLGALQHEVLAKVPGRIVLFIDEIDAVRSLPFSTDEFFAAIRQCYNRRPEDPEFARLSICLLGVATPSDLIQDTRTTPFNIGRRIELTDFTSTEATPLAQGLRQGDRSLETLLQRVLHWTGGHPYLTQRLCQAVAEDLSVTDVAGVDRLCEALFFSARAQERDDNLLFVRERLLHSEADLASLLDLYGRVRRGKPIRDDDTNPLVSLLRLSGIVRSVHAELQVRNRIYERVFDSQWIRTHMPDAEVRRQRGAYRRGLLRATLVFAAILAVVAGLALTAASQARRADRQRRLADRQRQVAEDQRLEARRNLYAAQMSLAQQTEAEGNVGRALAILDEQRPAAGELDLRGFEWRHLWRRCQGDTRLTLAGHTEGLYSVAFAPDGSTLATASNDRTIRLWDLATGREIASLFASSDTPVMPLMIAFSPNGRLLAAAEGDWESADRPGQVRLWDVPTRREVAVLKGHQRPVSVVAFSPDGRLLASGSMDRTVRLWEISSHSLVATLKQDTHQWHALVFSPDGRFLFAGASSGGLHQWAVASRRQVGVFKGHTAGILSLAVSPDGQMLASGSEDNTVKLWRAATRREIATLRGHAGQIYEVAFSPDGKSLTSGSEDSTVKLWDLATRQARKTFRGHNGFVNSVAFSPDGRTLASGGRDITVKLWNVGGREVTGTTMRQDSSVEVIAFSPDGRMLATGNGDNTVRLWELPARRTIATLKGHQAHVLSLEFSPDGKMLASGSEDSTVKLWAARDRSAGRDRQPAAIGRSAADWREIAAFPGFKGGYGSVKFCLGGRLLAMQGRDAVYLRDLRTKRIAGTLDWKPEGWYLDVSPDGKILAVFSGDNTVTLWDVATRRVIGPLSGPAIGGVWFAPDGQTLVTGWHDGLKLWEVGSQRLLARLWARTDRTGEFAFSPDGQTLAAVSGNLVSLWNLAIRQEVLSLKGHTGMVRTVAFSPDGRTLASGGADGTVRLWHAAPIHEADPLRIIRVSAGERAATLQWRPLPSVLAYRIYRGPLRASRAQLLKLTEAPATEASFTDSGPHLVNGRPLTYAVSAVYRGANGQALEGPPVIVQATPSAPPPGFMGHSIAEGPRFGSLQFAAPSGVITIRGSGRDLWNRDDQFYFMSRPVTGDFRITVRALTRPSATDVWAKAGLMLRESLEPGARDAFLITSPANGLAWQWRGATDDYTAHQEVLPDRALKLPITLRLTRRGDTVAGFYSWDDGNSFRPAAPPYAFEQPLPETLYAGLAITAHNASRISEAKFAALQIENLSPQR